MNKPLRVCITYDDNFEPMCAHLCSNLRTPGIQVRLNKTESLDDIGFRSSTWYMNLYEKMLFAYKNMQDLESGEILCVSDADIQFFKPEKLLWLEEVISDYDFEYLGQKEGELNLFNGGFFIVKKTEKILKMFETILSDDLKKYFHAEQDLINDLIVSMKIKSSKLRRESYVSGCIFGDLSINKDEIVMHHATCAYTALEKMEQMNSLRSMIGFEKINWEKYSGVLT